MTDAVIFDIDGTIADITHRLHHIKGEKKDWNAFFAACPQDEPIAPIINLVRIFDAVGFKILLVSGRSDKVVGETASWLAQHRVPFMSMYMRKDGDHRNDDILKEEILNGLIKDGYVIRYVVDDRSRVVEMWRRRGLTCLQCNQWDE